MIRQNHSSPSSPYESVVGYSRAVRKGPFIAVSGTTAFDPETGKLVAPGDAYGQAKQAISNAIAALAALSAKPEDVIRTRMFVKDIARDSDAVGRAHAETFGSVRPAATMVQGTLISDEMLVEIEVDAVVG